MLIGRDPGADDAYGRLRPDAPLPRDPNDPTIWLPGQGRANACGTTTLAYILRYLLGPGAPSRERIDRRVRRADIFSAPSLLVDYPRRLGLAARAYNAVDLDFVLGLVDRGVPVLVLTDTTPLDLTDTANLHWVAVVAHDDGRLAIYNPHGFQEEVDRASFASHWSQARLFGLPAWRRFAIAIARDPALLPAGGRDDLSAIGANWAANGVAEVVNYAVAVRWRLATLSPLRAALFGAFAGLGFLVPGAQTVFGALLLLLGAAVGRRPAV